MTQTLAEIILGITIVTGTGLGLRWLAGIQPSRFANVTGVVAAAVLLALIGQSSMASNLLGATVIEDAMRQLWVPAAMFGGAILLSVTL